MSKIVLLVHAENQVSLQTALTSQRLREDGAETDLEPF